MAIDLNAKEKLWADYQSSLAQAQKEQALARRQADEAALLRQRQMNQALMGRGLQYSGLQQTATAQNQAALSKQLNEQALQNTGAQAGLYQQYQQNLQGVEAQQQSLYTNIMNTALASGLTGTALTDYASKLASGYGTQLTSDQLSAITETGTVATPEKFVLTGDIEYNAKKFEPTQTLVTPNGLGSMRIDGELITFTSFDDAASKYKDILSKRGIPTKDIEVIANRSGSTVEFKFKYNGKTYNRIIDALRDLEKNTGSEG